MSYELDRLELGTRPSYFLELETDEPSWFMYPILTIRKELARVRRMSN